MRRKTSRSPFAPREARELRPARGTSFLPTAAALALALAGLGCSSATLEAVGPDPVAAPKPPPPPPPPAPSVAPSSSAPFAEPDPHLIRGGLGVVLPRPLALRRGDSR